MGRSRRQQMFIDQEKDQQKVLPKNGRCSRCSDSGLWVSTHGNIEQCPDILLGLQHPQPNAAAQMIDRAVTDLKGKGLPIDLQYFEITRELARHTSTDPCPRKDLLDKFFSYLPMTEKNQIRKLQQAVEDLRR